MARKKKEQEINYFEMFGTSKEYRILLLESPLNLFRMALKARHLFCTDFHYLGKHISNPKHLNAHFEMMYGFIQQPENRIDIVLLENKTTQFNQQTVLRSNKEKNLGFQTLSLFEEPYYLFNSQGFSSYKTQYADCDYIVLFSIDKNNNDLDKYVNILLKSEKRKCHDITHLLAEEKENAERLHFLRELFWETEIGVNQFHQKKVKQLLDKQQIIPPENQLSKLFTDLPDNFNQLYTNLLEFISLPDDFNQVYSELLGKDTSFE